MKWHKYSEEKPNPLEICLIKSYYDKQKFGESKLQYMLCEYSFFVVKNLMNSGQSLMVKQKLIHF